MVTQGVKLVSVASWRGRVVWRGMGQAMVYSNSPQADPTHVFGRPHQAPQADLIGLPMDRSHRRATEVHKFEVVCSTPTLSHRLRQ